MMEWTSVEDELPEDGTDVLVWTSPFSSQSPTSYHFAHFVYGDNDEHIWVKNPYSTLMMVTHWMPLPEPPRSR